MVITRKGRNTKDGGSKHNKKSTKAIGKSQLRSSLTPIFRMFSSIKLMEKHIVQLRKTPFWLLIEAFLEGRVNSKHAKNYNSDAIKVAQTYVERLEGFKIGEDTVVQLKDSDIECIFGILSGEKNIEIPKLSGKPVNSAFYSRRLSNVPKLDNKNLREQLDVAIAGNSLLDDEDVARIICLLLFVNIFFTTTGTSMKWGYVQLVEDLETMTDYAWSKLIKKKLLESVKRNQNKPENISGCSIALQYWLCLHSTMCEVKKADEYPVFLQYNTFELHAAISDRLVTFPLPLSNILPNEKPRHQKLLDLLSKRERRIVLFEKEKERAGDRGTDNNIENEKEEADVEFLNEREKERAGEMVIFNGSEKEKEEEDVEFLYEKEKERTAEMDIYDGSENEKEEENEEFIFENENRRAADMEIDDDIEEEFDFDESCYDIGNFVARESKDREKGVLEEEFERMSNQILLLKQEKQELKDESDILRNLNQFLENEMKNLRKKNEVQEESSAKVVLEMEFERMRKEFNLLEQEKKEFKDSADMLRELNQKLENEIKNLKENFKDHENCSGKLDEKEREIEILEKNIQKLEEDNNSLTDTITELTVSKITQSDIFNPFKEEKVEKEEKIEKEEEEEKEAIILRSMVRNIKNKSRIKKEDPNYDYPPLKIPKKRRSTKLIVKEDDDFQAIPAKKGKTIDVDELPTPKPKIKKRWVLNEKKYPVIGLLDDADKLLINKMQDYENHASIVWSGEGHLSIVSFEDLKAIIKEDEISNMVLDSYGELLTLEQENHGLHISEKAYIFTSNIMFYLQTKENEDLKKKHFDSKVPESMKYGKIIVPLIARSSDEKRRLNHWTVIVVDTKKWTWRHYNSLKPRGRKADPYFQGAENFKKAFENVAKRKCGNFVQTMCPQQSSGTVDCGVVASYIIGQTIVEGTINEKMALDQCQDIRAFLVQKFLYDKGRSWSEEEHQNSLLIKSVADNQ